MLEFFLYVILIISLTTLFYEVISLVYKIPDVKVEKKINRLKKMNRESKNNKENILLIRFFVPLFRYIVGNVKGFRYNEFKLKADLEKIGVKESPEVYMATGFLYGFIALIASWSVWLLTGGKFFMIIGLFFVMFLPFYPKSSLKGKIKKINEQFIKEFPNFVGALRYQYGKGKTLNDIVQSYIEVAGPALKYELQKLSAELEMMSDSEALLRFGQRVGLIEVNNFASSLVYGQMYGMDINSIFAIQEQEMRRLLRDSIMKDMKRKPLTLTVILMLPILNILLIVGLPPIVSFMQSMKGF